MLQKLIETQQLANQLMREHGLTEQGWKFRFGNTKTSVGTCHHKGKVIEFSKFYITSTPDEIKDTILHEIAHALVGRNHGHNYVWRKKAIEIGCRPERVAGEEAAFDGNYNWLMTCPNHDPNDLMSCPAGPWRRHRMTQRAWYSRCPNCHSNLTVLDLKTGDIFKTSGGIDSNGG